MSTYSSFDGFVDYFYSLTSLNNACCEYLHMNLCGASESLYKIELKGTYFSAKGFGISCLNFPGVFWSSRSCCHIWEETGSGYGHPLAHTWRDLYTRLTWLCWLCFSPVPGLSVSLVNVMWYYMVVLMCISLITNEADHLFMCLLVYSCIFSWEKCLFKSFILLKFIYLFILAATL